MREVEVYLSGVNLTTCEQGQPLEHFCIFQIM